MENLSLWVNGLKVEVMVGPEEMLADVLRDRLRLTGTKIGCNEAECGTCTVLMDGEPVLSCTLPALKAAGRRGATIEGLTPPQGARPGPRIRDARGGAHDAEAGRRGQSHGPGSLCG